MSLLVEAVDLDAAWDVYYTLADRRHQPGLTIGDLATVIAAALIGVVEVEKVDHSNVGRVRYRPETSVVDAARRPPP